MTLLLNNRIVNDDQWFRLDDEQQLLSDNADYAILDYQRYLQRGKDGEPLSGGISIGPDDDVSALAAFVAQLGLVCIEFPVFTDGRGYTHARVLRKRLGYAGELRAVGDIREDQILFMQRMGIDSFECNSTPDIQLLQTLTARFEHNYQPSYRLPSAS